MAKSRELRWKLGVFTAETMPLDRLAEYLRNLAIMLGEPEHLHLVKVETGSTSAVLRVDEQAFDRIRRRGQEIGRGTAPREAMESFRAINRLLREDGGAASLKEGQAEIIQFPGAEQAEAEPITGIKQQGTLDGQLLKVGGAGTEVPIQLLTTDRTKITGCYANRSLAKKMGSHLFEPVRLFGRGRWIRSPDGDWSVERFKVDEFEPLSDESLPNVVAKLRNIDSDWHPKPVQDILSDENG